MGIFCFSAWKPPALGSSKSRQTVHLKAESQGEKALWHVLELGEEGSRKPVTKAFHTLPYWGTSERSPRGRQPSSNKGDSHCLRSVLLIRALLLVTGFPRQLPASSQVANAAEGLHYSCPQIPTWQRMSVCPSPALPRTHTH